MNTDTREFILKGDEIGLVEDALNQVWHNCTSALEEPQRLGIIEKKLLENQKEKLTELLRKINL